MFRSGEFDSIPKPAEAPAADAAAAVESSANGGWERAYTALRGNPTAPRVIEKEGDHG